jgi:transcription antitermination factor NusA-like protein
LREQNPDVYFDVQRNTSTIHLEGLADDVDAVQDALVNFDIQQESRSLTSIEVGVIVGKKGVNINLIIDEHKVAIDVAKSGEKYHVTVAGPSSNVEAAMESIGELLDLNKDVTERIAIDPLVKIVFLKDSGAHIKQLQKDINAKTKENGGSVLINIDKEAAMQDCNLLVKARRPALVIALEMLDEDIEKIMKSVVTVQVDPYIVPRIIGKNGSNIKQMKQQGKGVIIEAHKTGTIQLFGESEDVEAVVQSIDKVVQENQVERIDCDASSCALTFRALVRAKSNEINTIVSGMDLDEESSQIVLRGTVENVSICSSAANAPSILSENCAT